MSLNNKGARAFKGRPSVAGYERMRREQAAPVFDRRTFVLGSSDMAETVTRPGRNELCNCGSGKKFKRCCGAAEAPRGDAEGNFFRVAGVLVAVMLLVGAIAVARTLIAGDGDASHRVWSAEHGHWHVTGGNGAKQAVAPGKVWNPEHGHFLDAPIPDLARENKPQPGALEDRAKAAAEAASAKAKAEAVGAEAGAAQ